MLSVMGQGEKDTPGPARESLPMQVIPRGRRWTKMVTLLSSQPLRFEEERKRLLYGGMALVVVLMLLSFGSYHLINGPRREGIIDLLVAAYWLTSLLLIRGRVNGMFFYRLTALICGGMFMYFASLGEHHGYRALWVFTYPAFCFFIVGIAEGLLYSLMVLAAWLYFMLMPETISTSPEFSGGFIARFTAAYMTIFFMSLYVEYVRQLVYRTMERNRKRLQQANTDLIEAKSHYRVLAMHDDLTGVANRRAILQQLEHEISVAASEKRHLAVAMLDIDHFKQINDRRGHLTGDAVLVETVGRIKSQIRMSDSMGRYGGEEFLMLFPGLDASAVQSLSERVRLAVSESAYEIDGLAIDVTVSIGCVSVFADIPDAAELIHAADQALYRAKDQGRDRTILGVSGS